MKLAIFGFLCGVIESALLPSEHAPVWAIASAIFVTFANAMWAVLLWVHER